MPGLGIVLTIGRCLTIGMVGVVLGLASARSGSGGSERPWSTTTARPLGGSGPVPGATWPVSPPAVYPQSLP